jgi:hypothetical protein
MPLPMVHLAVAMRMHALAGREPSPAFLLGSIAPDAIHMREGTSRGDKERTHLEDGCGGRPVRPYIRADAVPDEAAGTEDPYGMETVRLFLSIRDDIGADLRAGYGTHVITDRYWARDWVTPYRALQGDAGLTVEELRAVYYREMDQIDFDLYHTVPWREAVWAQLAAVKRRAIPGLLEADEIGRWRDRTLRWFDDPAHLPGITPQHVTIADARRFIDQSAARIAAVYGLWGVTPWDDVVE